MIQPRDVEFYRIHKFELLGDFLNIPFIGIQFEVKKIKKLIFFKDVDSELR